MPRGRGVSLSLRVTWLGGHEGPPGRDGWDLLRGLREARVVSRSRTTLTEEGLLDLPSGPLPVHRKVYAYRGVRALLGGAFRTTFAAEGRAAREAEALRLLGALGLAPEPVALAERRTGGFLREAMLASRTVEGARPLDALPVDAALAAAAGRAAGRIHAAGLADLDLAPRNLVCVPRGGSLGGREGGHRAPARGGARGRGAGPGPGRPPRGARGARGPRRPPRPARGLRRGGRGRARGARGGDPGGPRAPREAGPALRRGPPRGRGARSAPSSSAARRG
jgi:hypothetical protein